MKKTRRTSGKQTGIKVGDISEVSGTVNIARGNITTHHTTTGLSAVEIRQLFDQIYTNIETRPGTSSVDKEDLRAEVKEIQSTITEAAQKKKDVDEGFLARRFRNIARMAPDVLEVIVATLANPLAGLGAIVKRVAHKAKEEAQ